MRTTTERNTGQRRPGALVISLDFELHWGVRDTQPVNGPYRGNLLGAREAVPRMLELFDRYATGATWATVGMLFARNRDEWREYSPAIRPRYTRPQDDPYQEAVGWDEKDDPLHYAPSLIDAIRQCPRQEIATHTYSHYYCLDPGHTREAFEADIGAAVKIAASRGITMRSIVFPRMQTPPECLPVIRRFGIRCWRGTERSWMYQAGSTREMRSPWRRLARIADAYVDATGSQSLSWDALPQADGDCNVGQSRFLRPYSRRFHVLEPLRLRRIANAMEHAARHGEIYHLCWHPHNFGVNLGDNLRFLTAVLEKHRQLAGAFRFPSMTMWEAAQGATQASPETTLQEALP